MKRNKYIQRLIDSPCSKCGCVGRCNEKIERVPKFQEIQDVIFGNADFDYHDCGIWIALNAPEMVEVDDEHCVD